MSDDKSLSVQIGVALEEYGAGVRQGLEEALAGSMRRFVKGTREAAPVSSRRSGRFSGQMHLFETFASQKQKSVLGSSSFLWFARRPGSRILHLVEHGFNARDGRFVNGAHFVRRALEQEEPKLMEAVEEVIRNGG